MYVIDPTHGLDPAGAIAPERGPARKFADFAAAVVAHATAFDRPESTPGPLCFKCQKRDRSLVETGLTEDNLVVWRCLACGIDGQATTTARACGHVAHHRARLGEIANSGIDLLPFCPPEAFEAEVRACHARQAAFWAHVNGTRRDRHAIEDDKQAAGPSMRPTGLEALAHR